MPTRPPIHRPIGWAPPVPWQRTASQAAAPLPKGWARTRARVLREEPLCRPCNEAGRVSAALEVDHIVPRTQGGSSERANLQGICRECHRAKTAAEAVASRQQNR